MHQQRQPLHHCIRVCGECALVCAETSIHCLGMGREHAAPEHQVLLQDCADICATAVRFMARRSPHHVHVCRECAEICTRCASECEDMADGDGRMLHCAEICRRCADSCYQMSASAMDMSGH